MALRDSFKKLIGIEDGEDLEFTEEELEQAKSEIKLEDEEKARKPYFVKEEKTPQQMQHEQIVRTLTGTQQVVLHEPKSFEECPKLVDCLKAKRPVIINLEKIETETARKIFDFLSGAAYALNGNVQRIANNIFIFAPENVNISQNEERNFDYGNSKSPWK